MTLPLLADLIAEPDWMTKASCRDMPHEWWFPSVGGNQRTIKKAKAVCAGCPVIAPCLDLAAAQPFGIWGGLTVRERRKLRKKEAA